MASFDPTRRRWLFTATGTLPAFAIAAPPRPRVELLDCELAGWIHHHGNALRNVLRAKQTLRLEREPANPHDPHAVAIHAHGRRIGYIPRLANRSLAAHLDQGATIEAEIVDFQPQAAPWQCLRLRVWLA